MTHFRDLGMPLDPLATTSMAKVAPIVARLKWYVALCEDPGHLYLQLATLISVIFKIQVVWGGIPGASVRRVVAKTSWLRDVCVNMSKWHAHISVLGVLEHHAIALALLDPPCMSWSSHALFSELYLLVKHGGTIAGYCRHLGLPQAPKEWI